MKVKPIVLAAIALSLMFLAPSFLVRWTVSDFPPEAPGEYSPWGDLNDDGIINIFDIVWVAGRYQTTGTPLNITDLLLDLQSRVEYLEGNQTSFTAAINYLLNEITILETCITYLNASNIECLIAGETISTGDVVYMSTDGKVYKAFANVAGAANGAFGIALETRSRNQEICIQLLLGTNTKLSGLAKGSLYYLQDATTIDFWHIRGVGSGGVTNSISETEWWGQTFTTPSSLKLAEVAFVTHGPAANGVFRLFQCGIDHKPTGAPLYTDTTGFSQYNIIKIDPPLILNASTEYCFVLSSSSGQYNSIGVPNPVIGNPTYMLHTTNGGASWTTTSDQVFDQTIQEWAFFCKYYSAGDSGVIGTSMGTFPIKLGVAKNSTTLIHIP